MARTIGALLWFMCVGSGLLLATAADAPAHYERCLETPHTVRVRMQTELGNIDLELYGSRAPVTVCNFIRYVDQRAYDGGTFFRTVRPDNQVNVPVKIAVVQGDVPKGTRLFPPIPMENTARTGIHHVSGTISMARDGPETATSEIFITVNDQRELDFGGKRNPDGQGFAAFGRVVRGMEVVKRIWMQPAQGEDITRPVSIQRIYVLEDQPGGK